MPNCPPMIRPYLSDARIGDGHRSAFVLRETEETAQLYVPSLLATVTVPRACVAKARRVGYRPRVVRANLLSLVRCYRRHGRRFPHQATVRLLRLLGATRAAIDAAMVVEPLPEVVEARARRAACTALVAAIRARIEHQAAEAESDAFRAAPASHAQGCRRPGRHPDQMTLAL